MTRSRLDIELVRRGLASSRTRAAGLVAAGRVRVEGELAQRAAAPVDARARLVVLPRPDGSPDPVSRAGDKLAVALRDFDLDVRGRRCLDAGASTGGFTDVLLQAGAAHVHAVDVGHGQLDRRLLGDPRVTAYEGTNVRTLTPTSLGGRVALTVADLSFIPLPLVLPALVGCTDDDLVVLVKPQFEVGRERLGNHGVVLDPALRRAAVETVVGAATDLGWSARGARRSPLTGQNGNVEVLLWLQPAAAGLTPQQAATAVDHEGAVLAVRG